MRRAAITLLILLAAAVQAAAGGLPVIEGWSPSGPANTYGPDNLWKYNNGAADLYITFGFKELEARGFACGDQKVTAGLFDMGTRLGAFGIFSAEAGGAAGYLPIGAGTALALPYQCSMFKGRYYVKIDASSGNLDGEGAEHLLQSIAEVLPGDDHLPDELRALPAEGKTPGSEGYVRQSFLGMGVLKNCVYASYVSPETGEEGRPKEEYRVFLLLPGAGRDDKDTWAELEAKWKPVERNSTPVLMKQIPYQGPAVVALTDKGVFGVVGPEALERVTEILLCVTAGARDID